MLLYNPDLAKPKIEIVKGDYKYTRYEDTGWSVETTDKTKTEYGPIENEIDGIPVVSLDFTFHHCDKLVNPPVIPNTVKLMRHTFQGCFQIANLGDYNIPNSVEYLDSAFADCKNMTIAPQIPNSVINITNTFLNCVSLKEMPKIPDNIKQIGTFDGCISLNSIADNILSDNEPIKTDFTTDTDEKGHDGHDEL